jgi:hypothetical protein
VLPSAPTSDREWKKSEPSGGDGVKAGSSLGRYFRLVGDVAGHHRSQWRQVMGRGILLWLLGVPIPIIIILALLFH